MLKALGLGLLFLASSAGAAMAQEVCGGEPIAPVIVSDKVIKQKSPADAEAAKHSAFVDIRRWQSGLKSYRDCINATIKTDNRQANEAARADKPDKDKIARLQQEIASANHAYDQSTNDEEIVVNDFNAVSTAYCTRTDVDRSTCPKR